MLKTVDDGQPDIRSLLGFDVCCFFLVLALACFLIPLGMPMAGLSRTASVLILAFQDKSHSPAGLFIVESVDELSKFRVVGFDRRS
ncbi:MAG: hypothetical protein ACXV7J_00200 [Methylomonas sp.]